MREEGHEQALQASLWARAVAAQTFQSFAVARAHRDARVKVEGFIGK